MDLDISCFRISELQIDTLASEFYARASFPSGDHDMCHIEFTPPDGLNVTPLQQSFLAALRSYELS